MCGPRSEAVQQVVQEWRLQLQHAPHLHAHAMLEPTAAVAAATLCSDCASTPATIRAASCVVATAALRATIAACSSRIAAASMPAAGAPAVQAVSTCSRRTSAQLHAQPCISAGGARFSARPAGLVHSAKWGSAPAGQWRRAASGPVPVAGRRQRHEGHRLGHQPVEQLQGRDHHAVLRRRYEPVPSLRAG